MGRVVDSAGRRPIAGIEVRLVAVSPARDTVVASARTSAEGTFVLDAPKPGTYRVRFSEAQVGPPILLTSADADDQREYVLGPVPPPNAPSNYHVLHGVELDSAVRAGTPLLACQVDKNAAFVPGTIVMQFPPDVGARHPTGSVLASFVVDSLGHYDRSTLQIVRAPGTDEAFEALVARGLAKSRFYAAITDGRQVQQRMYVPVVFRLNTAPPPDVLEGSPCGPRTNSPPVFVTSGYRSR